MTVKLSPAIDIGADIQVLIDCFRATLEILENAPSNIDFVVELDAETIGRMLIAMERARDDKL